MADEENVNVAEVENNEVTEVIFGCICIVIISYTACD